MAIDLLSVRNRVRDTGLFLSVGDTLDLAEALDTSFIAPAAFISLPTERADPHGRVTGPHRQRVNARVSIAFCLKAQRADVERTDEIEAIRTVLRSHLGGWKPTGADRVFEYATSSVRSIANGMIWVEMLFDTEYSFNAI